jgi:hypothetical protein
VGGIFTLSWDGLLELGDEVEPRRSRERGMATRVVRDEKEL